MDRILGYAVERSFFGVYLAIVRRDLLSRRLMLDLNYKFGIKHLVTFNYPQLLSEFVLECSKREHWPQVTTFNVVVMLLKKRQLSL